MMTAVERAATRKQEMYSNQQQKADFLQSLMGKGILMLSLSMIKYRCCFALMINNGSLPSSYPTEIPCMYTSMK